MDRFGPVLRRVDRGLKVPEPERSRILMEVAADLEDLYRNLRLRGLEEEAARREAERRLAPADAALASLQSVHLPAVERLLRRLGHTTRGRLELATLVLISLGAAAAAAFGVVRSGTVSASAPGLWMVAALAAAGLGQGVARGYALFFRGDPLRSGWRRGIDGVLAAAAATALAGLVAGAVRLTLTVPEAGAGGAATGVWTEVAVASGVAALGLCASVLLALLWLALRVRAEVVGRAHVELRTAIGRLDLDDSDPKREETR